MRPFDQVVLPLQLELEAGRNKLGLKEGRRRRRKKKKKEEAEERHKTCENIERRKATLWSKICCKPDLKLISPYIEASNAGYY